MAILTLSGQIWPLVKLHILIRIVGKDDLAGLLYVKRVLIPRRCLIDPHSKTKWLIQPLVGKIDQSSLERCTPKIRKYQYRYWHLQAIPTSPHSISHFHHHHCRLHPLNHRRHHQLIIIRITEWWCGLMSNTVPASYCNTARRDAKNVNCSKTHWRKDGRIPGQFDPDIQRK